MSTITTEQQQAIREFLANRHIPMGLGNAHEACSIAAINLALSGELTDNTPDCMSLVIGRWIIGVQDAMPDAMRNSDEWRRLLPLAAGTGRDREKARGAIILDWLWGAVLPQLQPIADKGGYGPQWREMCEKKTSDAATYAARAADAATYAARAAADAAYAADTSAAAAYAARAAAYAAYAYAAYAAAAYAARAAAYAAYAYAAYAAAADVFWTAVDPCALLAKLIDG